jgi:ribosome-associated translation inhibitor RaiA
MSNQNTISVQLTVKDDGSVVMKQFGRTTEEEMGKAGNSAKKTTSSFDTLKSSYLDMAAKAATAYMAIQKAMEYMDKGAKASQAEASFRTLAQTSGESADKIIADMKRATNGTIDDSMLMQKAVKASLLDLTTGQTTQLAEMARLAARTTGEDVSTAFDNIVNAISTKMPRALKQYGLITKEQQTLVNQAMAEGVEDVGLFSIAWENYNKQLEKTGPIYENNAERLQQYKAKIEDTKETFGKHMNVASDWLLTNLSEGLKNYTATLAAITTGSSAPIKRWAAEKVGIEESEA